MNNLTRKLTLKKGFTLVEVLIVILIIALLMAFIIPQVLKGPQAARDATRIAHVGQLAVATEALRSAQREYPKTAPVQGCFDPDTDVLAKALVEGGFMSADKFPEDPDKNNTTQNCKGFYYYKIVKVNGADRAGIVIFSKLETSGRATAELSDLNVSDLTKDTKFGVNVQNRQYYHQSSGQ